MKRRLTVYLSEALARSLKVRAAREGVTLSALIEEVLKAARVAAVNAAVSPRPRVPPGGDNAAALDSLDAFRRAAREAFRNDSAVNSDE